MQRPSAFFRRIVKIVATVSIVTLKISIVISFVGHVSTTDTAGTDGFMRYTAPAQHSNYTFCGGTVSISLNASTSTFIKDNCAEPLVFLAEGEVLANVRPSASRPFRIIHNHIVLVVLGTQFDVSAHETAADVSATSGAVRVYEQGDDGRLKDPIVLSPMGARRAQFVLHGGDLARAEERDGTVLVTPDANDPRAAENRTSWRQEEYIIDKQRLDSVVWEFNRYSHTQIVLGDREVEQMRLGGRYRLTRTNEFLSQLRGLDLEVIRVDGDEVHPPRYIVRLPTHVKAAPGRKSHDR